MGIPSQVARVILREHRFRPITGRLLSVGKQTVQLTPHQAISLIKAELGIRLDVDPSKLEVDRWTRGAENRNLISDRAFYSLFCDAQYHCLDQSDYENANIVFDLCNANLDPALENGFDFVFDGSVLDNVFDPAAALRNMARIARIGGRVLHVNRASRSHHVYVAFALSWFHDFYSINEFDDCQVYLAQWDDSPLTSRWDFYHYRPLRKDDDGALKFFGEDTWYQPWRHAHAIVIAEKGSPSTWQKSPTQFEYRANVRDRFVDSRFEAVPLDPAALDQDPYSRAAARFSRTRRPPPVKPEERVELPPELYNYAPEIVYCGSLEPISAR
jgi:SAM-dependent methyltransferase